MLQSMGLQRVRHDLATEQLRLEVPQGEQYASIAENVQTSDSYKK